MLPPGHAARGRPIMNIAAPPEALIDAHLNRFARPDHESRGHPDCRTICGSPARCLHVSGGRGEAPKILSVVTSRAGEFQLDRLPRTGEIQWKRKCAISSRRWIRRVGWVHSPNSWIHPRDRYPHVRDGPSRVGVDHAAAECDRDGMQIGIRQRTGGGQLFALAPNVGYDARRNRDGAKMSQHIRSGASRGAGLYVPT